MHARSVGYLGRNGLVRRWALLPNSNCRPARHTSRPSSEPPTTSGDCSRCWPLRQTCKKKKTSAADESVKPRAGCGRPQRTMVRSPATTQKTMRLRAACPSQKNACRYQGSSSASTNVWSSPHATSNTRSPSSAKKCTSHGSDTLRRPAPHTAQPADHQCGTHSTHQPAQPYRNRPRQQGGGRVQSIGSVSRGTSPLLQDPPAAAKP